MSYGPSRSDKLKREGEVEAGSKSAKSKREGEVEVEFPFRVSVA